MEGQPRTYSLTITLSGYNRELQYTVQRELKRLVIEPKFDYRREEFRYIVGHLFSEKRLTKQAKRQGPPFIPQTLTERQAVADHFLEQIEQYRPSATVQHEKPQH